MIVSQEIKSHCRIPSTFHPKATERNSRVPEVKNVILLIFSIENCTLLVMPVSRCCVVIVLTIIAFVHLADRRFYLISS